MAVVFTVKGKKWCEWKTFCEMRQRIPSNTCAGKMELQKNETKCEGGQGMNKGREKHIKRLPYIGNLASKNVAFVIS